MDHGLDASVLAEPAAALGTRSYMQVLRALAAVSAAVLVCVLALLDERPLPMMVGFSPLALLASECAWHLLDETRG